MGRLILGAAALAAAASAQAQPFDGPYAGAQAGWGSREGGLAAFSRRIDRSRSGFDYSVFAGYNFPVGGSVVAGAEAEIVAGGKTLRGSGPVDEPVSVDPKWNYAVTGRLGWTLSERVLIYARAGYSAERVRHRYEGPVAAVIGVRTTRVEWLDGLLVGGGAELAVGTRATLRAEYRHRDAERGFSAEQLLVGAALSF